MSNSKSIFFLLQIIFLLAFSLFTNAQNSIHVYSTEIPWQDEAPVYEETKLYSINDAIALAQEGDVIIVHSGVYREKVTVTKNNIEITSGEDDYVLVTGAELVSGWKQATGMASGIYEADISSYNIETDFTQFFIDGNAEMMARHPNNTTGKMMEPMEANCGYALLSNVFKDAGAGANAYATLTGTTIPNVNITGGIFRGLTGKNRNYICGDISNKSGNTITFKATNKGVWMNETAVKNTQHKYSWGFVMHKNLIDIPGEWFVDGNTIYYMPFSTKSIEESRAEIQVRERVLVLNNTSDVSISGIHFVAGNVDMQNTNNATIDGCSMRYLYPFWKPYNYGQNETEKKGVYLSNSSDNLFKDTYVAHSWGNMFALKDGNNNQFENCVIKDYGWIGVFTSGIYNVKSDNALVSKCTLGEAGRFHIRVSGGDARMDILDCDFYDAMKMGEDAGPIEATSTGRIGALDLKGSVIAYNKIRDTHGLPVSDGGYSKQKIVAFYMEDTENYTAHHNLVYNIRANNYTGTEDVLEYGEFLYLGPRYNAMHKPVNYYNNTVWDVDAGISIWNIEIDNWEELGVVPPDTTGMMEDGHFANNIFMQGMDFKLSYVRQKINSTGGNQQYVTLENSPSMTTYDFNAYTSHCAKHGYNFNPENNQMYQLSDGLLHFSDASTGDFSLLAGSSAIESGIVIDGITSGDNPDCGAFEGGDRVLHAGADLDTPDFKEVAEREIDTWIKNTHYEALELYPNPTKSMLFVNDISKNANIKIYTLSGKLVLNREVTRNGVSVNFLPSGIYVVHLSDVNTVKVGKFVKE